MKNPKKNGFTLIELLVVITIIGVLATLIMANFANIRERSRDVRRKSDLKQIQKALELYKESQTDGIHYPEISDWITLDSSLENGNYMKTVPVDPVNSGDFIYTYNINATDNLNYRLYACLENASDQDGEVDEDACPTTSNHIKYELNAP